MQRLLDILPYLLKGKVRVGGYPGLQHQSFFPIRGEDLVSAFVFCACPEAYHFLI